MWRMLSPKLFGQLLNAAACLTKKALDIYEGFFMLKKTKI